MTPADLAARGFRVFPLLPGSKKPRVSGWTEPGAEYAFADGDNVGIFTGAYGEGKALLVVDIDNKADKRGDDTILKLEIEGHEFPQTLETITPTGGRHLFYVVDDPVRQGVDVLGPGVDIRSAGGYVVAPPSRLDSLAVGDSAGVGVYAFAEPAHPLAPAPQWLIDACGQPRERIERANEKPLTGYAAEVAYAKALKYLQEEAPTSIEGDGGDLTAYKVACRVRDFGVLQSECLSLLLDWNELCQPPWHPDALARKVRNAYSYALNEAGAANPAAVFEPVASSNAGAPAGVGTRYRLESVSEVLGRPPPPWLVRGLLPQRGLSMLFGPPGSGKTFLCFDLGCAIARGLPWAQRRTRRGPAVYVGLEGHIGTRLRAYVKHNELHPDDLSDLRIIERQHLSLLADKDAAELVLAIKATGIAPALVVIDTLNRSMPGGDENSSQDMGKVIAQAGLIADYLECAVLFIHHSGKNEDAGARGHSSLQGAVDAALAVSRTETGDRIVEAVKVKDGEDGDQFAFTLDTVDLGAVRDFDPEADATERLTSCVVTNLHSIARTTKPKKVRLGMHAVNGLKALRDTLAFYAGDPGRAFEDDSVIGEQWQAAFAALYENEKDADKKFYAARAELMSKGVVVKADSGRYALTETGKMV